MKTKDKLIEIAQYLFLQKGYEKVSISEISQASGIAKPTFYHHFKSKEELFLEVLDDFFKEATIWTKDLKDVNKTFREGLHSVFEHVENLIKANNKIPTLSGQGNYGYYFLLFDGLKMFRQIREKYKNEYIDDFNDVKLAVDRAKAKGEIRQDLDWENLAIAMASLIEGILILNSVYPNPKYKNVSEIFFEVIWSYCSANK